MLNDLRQQPTSDSISHVARRNRGIIVDSSVFFLCVLSFFLSWIESTINSDSHHWGFMYVPALDLTKGLVPYKQVLIAYGYLTTWLQAISLNLLGDSLKSIGLVTGLFYSLSLWLSYRVFLTFLSKSLSLFSVLLIFLLHPYIVHPWPNYFSYTLELLSLLAFINGRTPVVSRFIAGVCLGLACLLRYSSIVAILSPFVIYLCYEVFIVSTDRRLGLKRLMLFGAGFIAPLVWFFGFLLSKRAWYDFYIQNRVIAESWDRGVTLLNFLPRLLNHIVLADTWPIRDSRSICFSVVFCVALVAVCYLVRKVFLLKKGLSKTENTLVLVSLVTLCGYLNSIHIYQIFRLINGSSIGVGLIVYALGKPAKWKDRKGIKPALIVASIILCSIWSKSLLFTETSSVYLPWNRNIFAGKRVRGAKIEMFQGKWLSDEYYNFYDEVSGILSRFDRSYYVINYTWDPLLTVLGSLKRAQIVPFYLGPPFYLPFAENGYRDEPREIEQIIASKKAVILTTAERKVPGYKLVFAKPWSKDTPWFAQISGMKLYISIPEVALEEAARSGR